MPKRDPLLENFLTSLADAFRARDIGNNASAAMARIYKALRTPRAAGGTAPERRPVCSHLDEALQTALSGPREVGQVAETFAALEPTLSWKARHSGGPSASDNWPEGHANTTIIGRGGLEDRSDLSIGASLLAPHVRYPDHNHDPEEVYLVLSPGHFKQGNSEWFEPGIGGTLYNEPNIKHAMASGDSPLLALWCLWVGKPVQEAS